MNLKKPIQHFVVAFTILVAAPLPAAAEDVDSEKAELIKEIMEITRAGDLGMMMGQQMMESMKPLIESANPGRGALITDILIATIQTKFVEKMPELWDLITPVYAKHFTIEELKEILSIYKTPIGQKMVEKMPLIMQDSFEIGQVWGRLVGREAALEVIEALQQNNLNLPPELM